MNLYGGEDDRIFLMAASEIAQNNTFFPSPKEMSATLRTAKIREERRQLDEFYKQKNLYEYANLTDAECEARNTVDSMLGGAEEDRVDFYKIRENARQIIGGTKWLDQNSKAKNALEGV